MAGAIGALVAIAVMGAAETEQTSTTVRAERFEVVDQAGKVVATLDATGEEGPGLTLLDAAGKTRIWLNVTKDGPGLTLYDSAGKERAELVVSKDGPALTVYDAARRPRIWMNARKEGPGLTLYDAAGKGRVWLNVKKDGPGLTLYDAAEKRRALLGSTALATGSEGATEQTAEGSLMLFDSEGKVLFREPR